ncbi:uncharacterized protein LOC117301458 [Asterias rubens]|uniref:uncharacterized protein LOC117301458 n=1 Tax=Asterias rubens TaxID=7604 RepID=UPI001455C727|nr:uncharacterized protein LOC117301458 [Asterias rubens]
MLDSVSLLCSITGSVVYPHQCRSIQATKVSISRIVTVRIMTQGDQQQHPSGTTTAACSSCPKDVADSTSESRGISPPVETVSSSGMDGHHPHHYHHPHYHKEHTAPTSDGDVKTLLHFVNLASSDIKAALDKSAPIRKSSENRKFLQKQLKRSPPPFFNEDEIYKSSSAPVSPPVVTHDNHGFSAQRFISNLNSSPPSTNHQSSSSLHFSERLMASASLHRDHIKNSDLNLIKELTFGNIHRGTDQILSKMTSNSYRDKQHISSGREFTDMATLNHEEGGKNRENPLPLRKRRLPASFWQEPGKSENHKTTPGAMAGISPINASLKFPLLSSLTQGFTDSRPTSLDKNAIYPSSDHQCFPAGQSFMPSLSNSLNTESYLNRTLNFPYSSICSCHQHTELYGYDHHGPACATYASRHGGDAPGIFSSIGPTGLISSSRWHVPSLTTDRPDLCHPSAAPRVVKPIPTKSISSYPHRYHPIYT